MYKNHNYLLHSLGVLPFVILKFCPEHNINTIRDINLQPFSNKCLFGEHPSVSPIFLLDSLLYPGSEFVVANTFVK